MTCSFYFKKKFFFLKLTLDKRAIVCKNKVALGKQILVKLKGYFFA